MSLLTSFSLPHSHITNNLPTNAKGGENNVWQIPNIRVEGADTPECDFQPRATPEEMDHTVRPSAGQGSALMKSVHLQGRRVLYVSGP